MGQLLPLQDKWKRKSDKKNLLWDSGSSIYHSVKCCELKYMHARFRFSTEIAVKLDILSMFLSKFSMHI